MDSHLKASGLEEVDQIVGDLVILGNEVKGRPETQALLKLGKGPAVLQPLGGLHVMGQDQGELVPIGPAPPAIGGPAGALVDRPGVSITCQFPAGDFPANSNLKPSRNQGLKLIVEFVDNIKTGILEYWNDGTMEKHVELRVKAKHRY
jgi:hypothetical protein